MKNSKLLIITLALKRSLKISPLLLTLLLNACEIYDPNTTTVEPTGVAIPEVLLQPQAAGDLLSDAQNSVYATLLIYEDGDLVTSYADYEKVYSPSNPTSSLTWNVKLNPDVVTHEFAVAWSYSKYAGFETHYSVFAQSQRAMLVDGKLTINQYETEPGTLPLINKHDVLDDNDDTVSNLNAMTGTAPEDPAWCKVDRSKVGHCRLG